MIYFVQSGPGGPVKIGWSDTEAGFRARLASLQTAHPYTLVVLRRLEAPRWAEYWFHRQFAAVRLKGEWFEHQPEMLTICPGEVETVEVRPRLPLSLVHDRLSRGWQDRLERWLAEHEATRLPITEIALRSTAMLPGFTRLGTPNAVLIRSLLLRLGWRLSTSRSGGRLWYLPVWSRPD